MSEESVALEAKLHLERIAVAGKVMEQLAREGFTVEVRLRQPYRGMDEGLDDCMIRRLNHDEDEPDLRWDVSTDDWTESVFQCAKLARGGKADFEEKGLKELRARLNDAWNRLATIADHLAMAEAAPEVCLADAEELDRWVKAGRPLSGGPQ